MVAAVQFFPERIDEQVIGPLAALKTMMGRKNSGLPLVAAELDGQPQRERFVVDPRLDDVAQALRRRGGDTEAALAVLRDKPTPGESGEGLAERAHADVVAFAQGL